MITGWVHGFSCAEFLSSFSPQSLTMPSATLWCTLVFLGATTLAKEAGCPVECRCSKPRLCPAGVPLVWDDCTCCRVCAARFNEKCGALKPCAPGLRCQTAVGLNRSRGVCRAATAGRPCSKDGRVYQHGEGFLASCRLHCLCLDGKVGCRVLCPLHLPPPPASCPHPRLVPVPRTCCRTWTCPGDVFKELELGWNGEEGEWDDSGNEVVDQRLGAKRWRGRSRSGPRSRNRQGGGCRLHVTEWSPCTVTCGIGVSTRITTNNTRCRPKEESRLCQVRPCDMIDHLLPTKGSACLKTYKEQVPRPFVYNGCTSLQSYRPKYCGMCQDGRCCLPSESRSTQIRFKCPGVDSMVVTVAKIKRCACTRPQGLAAGCPRPPTGNHV